MPKKQPKRPCATVMINGSRKYFYGKTAREAEKKKEVYLEELRNPTIKLQKVIDEWSEIHEPEVAYKTWLGYSAHIKALEIAFGDINIKELSHLDISHMVQTMAKSRYADKTVRTRLNVLNMVMQHALYNRYITENPCTLVKVPKGLAKSKRELPSASETEKIKNSLSCHFGLFAYFLLFTGLRRGEALCIEWQDIDFNSDVIHINKSLFFKNNKPEIKSTKTLNGIRNIPLLLPLKVALLNISDKGTYLFGGDKLMTEQTFRRSWQRYCKESGVAITPHQLRHAFATILFDAEISSKSAQQILGHADYKTTMEIYTHISNTREQADTEKLNAYIADF